MREKSSKSAVLTQLAERHATGTLKVGANLLLQIARLERPATLTEIAVLAGLHASRTYRHLRALLDSGFLFQDVSGKYQLGAQAFEIGLTAIGQLDPVRKASAIMPSLTEKSGLVSGLLVWGSHGPTVIRAEHGNLISFIRLTEGNTHPLLTTASGKIFTTFLPRTITQPYLDAEFMNRGIIEADAREAEVGRIAQSVRQNGVAFSEGTRRPHSNLAVPVFDYRNELALSLTLIGPVGSFSTAPDSPTSLLLKSYAENLSRRLGATALPVTPRKKR